MQGALADAPWAALAVALPLAAGVSTLLFRGRPARAVSAGAALLVIGALALLSEEVFREGARRYQIGGWGAPLGIDLYADGLSVVMLWMTALVGAAVTAYSLFYFRGAPNESFFWPLWMLLWAALNAVFLSGDIFNLYVALEVMGISAVALVCIGGGVEAFRAGARYFFVAVIGSLSYLLGVAVLYAAYGTLDLASIGEAAGPGPGAATAAALMIAGLLAKTALFPLHFWLPRAHSSAPSPVSAVLSALVVKASFYIVLRLWTGPFESVLAPQAGFILGALGGAAVIWGALMALRQTRLKMLVAYSTVSQIGYLFLFFPMAANPDAFTGAVYQALSHAVAKASIFLAIGCTIRSVGNDSFDGLAGAGKSVQTSVFAFGISGASLMGLPPSGGFIAKWQLVKASVETGQWWWAAVIIAGGLLAAAYIFPVLRRSFADGGGEAEASRVPYGMEAAAMALAVLSVVLGMGAAVPLSFFR